MRRALCLVALGLLTACGASGVANGVVLDMDRMRGSADVRDAARFAPQRVALAENQRAAAEKASRDGDETAASLYAAQAIASYTDAVALARLGRATELSDAASADLARDEARAQKLSAEREAAEREADELDKKLVIARAALVPASSGRADPEREAARVVASRALIAQARLLCGAARLLDPSSAGFEPAMHVVLTLEAQLDKPGHDPAPIDAAARIRATCLALLTTTRRAADGPTLAEADALLSELSASGQFEPSRDERGVVVVLRDAFAGAAPSAAGAKQLAELGRVAVTHPGFAVQVVVHDASAPSAAEAAGDKARAQAAAAAIVAAGVKETRVTAETAGARAPVVDPRDARHRGRNARLEVVFVSPGG